MQFVDLYSTLLSGSIRKFSSLSHYRYRYKDLSPYTINTNMYIY